MSLYIAQSRIPGAGRGVFAGQHIKKNQIIERCPVIEIPKVHMSVVSETMLITYIYYLGTLKNKPVIVLGYGSIYNHSENPNARYKALHKNTEVLFVAVRDIKKGEEIVVHYNPDHDNHSNPLWFNSFP